MQSSDQLLSINSQRDKDTVTSLVSADDDELPLPTTQTLRKLNEQATSRLAQIAGSSNDGQYDDAEFAAVKQLLDKSTQATIR